MSGIVDKAPEPHVDHWDWLNAMSQLNGKINMRHYQGSPKEQRLVLVEATKRVTIAIRSKLLNVELTTINGEKVNCYEFTDDAKIWWQNGREQGLTPKEISDGWEAMRSIANELKKKDDE